MARTPCQRQDGVLHLVLVAVHAEQVDHGPGEHAAQAERRPLVPSLTGWSLAATRAVQGGRRDGHDDLGRTAGAAPRRARRRSTATCTPPRPRRSTVEARGEVVDDVGHPQSTSAAARGRAHRGCGSSARRRRRAAPAGWRATRWTGRRRRRRVALGQQPLDEVRADEPGATDDHDPHRRQARSSPSPPPMTVQVALDVDDDVRRDQFAAMQIEPFAPSGTSACVATMRSGEVLLFEISGSGVPHGNALTQASPVVSAAVTLTLTVVARRAPRTCRRSAPRGSCRASPPGRSCGCRAPVRGANPWKPTPAGNQPCRSTTRSTSVIDWKHTLPPVPIADERACWRWRGRATR